jgi:peroxiredoxin
MKRLGRANLVAIALLAALVIGWPAAREACTAEAEKTEPQKAPAFTLEDVDGKKVSLSDFADKIVVLEWMNPGCPIWARHHKAGTFRTLAEKYKDKGVVWLAINSTNSADKEKNKKFAETEKVPYPILDDHAGTVGKAYGAKTSPHMFVIDKHGLLAYEGAIDDNPAGEKEKPLNYVDQALTELLAGKAVSVPKTEPYGCSVKYAPQK